MIDFSLLTPKQQKKYLHILNTTEEMIYEHGFYKMSLSQLTHRLNISRATIYEYFSSKEGLVEQVVYHISKRLDNTLYEILENNQLGSREKFHELAKTQTENLDANCYKLLNDLKAHLPHLYKKFEEKRKERERNGYTLLVHQGIKEGIFNQDFDKDFILQLYLKMTQLLGNTDMLQHLRLNKREAMESIVNVFLKGTQ